MVGFTDCFGSVVDVTSFNVDTDRKAVRQRVYLGNWENSTRKSTAAGRTGFRGSLVSPFAAASMFGGMTVEFPERLIAGSASFPRCLSPSFTLHIADGPTRQCILDNSIEIDG